MILQPPFPDPVATGLETLFIGLVFAHILMLLFLIILMIYLYQNLRNIVPITITYMCSLVIGMNCLIEHIERLPLSPYLQIFFLSFQTGMFIMSALDYNENRKKR